MKKLNFLIGLFLISQFAFAQILSESFSWDGEVREYELFIPTTYDSTKVPLVLALHGMGDDGPGFRNIGFNSIANRENFIVVYPTALPDPTLSSAFGQPTTGWNVTLSPGNTTDDIGFLAAMTDSISAKYQIDTDRIYATGFSMGGFMCHRLACELGDRITAIASLSGTIPTTIISDCKPNRAVPALHMHGTADQTVPFDNSPIFVFIPNIGADSTVKFWANHNGCVAAPTEEQLPDTRNDGYTIEKFTYGNCNDSSEVLFYKITGAPHTVMLSNNDINATEEIWNFFSRHKKREAIPSAIAEFAESIYDVYPNPFTDLLTVDLGINKVRRLSVYDLFGKEVVEMPLGRIESVSLHLTHLRAGVYFLKLEDSKTTYVHKIIKQD